MTILEIGASCVQPIARNIGMEKWLNDKYKCTLIRINPLIERQEMYQNEEDGYEAIANQFALNIRLQESKQMLLAQLKRLYNQKKELKDKIRSAMNIQNNSDGDFDLTDEAILSNSSSFLDSKFDELLSRKDADESLYYSENGEGDGSPLKPSPEATIK